MKGLDRLTLKCVLERSAVLYATKPCVSWVNGKPIRYNEFLEQVKEIQLYLLDGGIGKGDKVAILSENSPNWGISYFAITTLGAIAVPILPDFRDNEVHHILRHSESKAVFISKKQFVKIEEFDDDQINLRILIDDFSILPPETTIAKLKKTISKRTRPISKLTDSALKLTGLRSSEVDEDDVACILYTSGTTGNSKGVVLTHKNLVFDSIEILTIQNVIETDRFVSVLPLPHTYECTLGLIMPIMKGASINYLDKLPTPSVLLPALQKIKPTIMLTVPLIMEKIFKNKIYPTLTANPISKTLYNFPPTRKLLHYIAGRKLYNSFGGKLHFYGIGGALLSADVEKFLKDAKFPYAIGYGLTETSPLIAGANPNFTKFRSTGTVPSNIKVRIYDPDPKTGEGEIQAMGDNVMKGYFKDPERTKEVFTDDGWFKTGDLGILKNGYLYIKGRLKNVIIGASGENIYPEDIESVINQHHDVLESIVYEADGKIVARVHLNYELIDKEHKSKRTNEKQMREFISDLLQDIRKSVNSQVSTFSSIKRIIEQREPFVKTPTKKIKRYLYTE
ncbi:MAG: AMP-binding protein [Candidatus Cloacimonetes bacterium]|nr:AMP-binding protein [Candidatus Cloacimonadota bacterium]